MQSPFFIALCNCQCKKRQSPKGFGQCIPLCIYLMVAVSLCCLDRRMAQYLRYGVKVSTRCKQDCGA